MSIRIDPEKACRVSIETRKYLEQQAQNIPHKFDHWDDGLMRDLVGENLAGPVATLLIILEQVERAEQTFGISKPAAFDLLRPALENLRAGMLKDFEAL